MDPERGQIRITVDEPMTICPEKGRKYTSYLVSLQTDNLCFNIPETKVRRRFSEFIWLRSWLHKFYPNIIAPELPPKKFFGQQFQPEVVEHRCNCLTTFLNEVVTFTLYLSDGAVHLFLQTQTPVNEIQKIVDGQTDKDVLEVIMEAGKLDKSLIERKEYCKNYVKRPGILLTFPRAVQNNPEEVLAGNITPTPNINNVFSPTRPYSPILSFLPVELNNPTDNKDEEKDALFPRSSSVVSVHAPFIGDEKDYLPAEDFTGLEGSGRRQEVNLDRTLEELAANHIHT